MVAVALLQSLLWCCSRHIHVTVGWHMLILYCIIIIMSIYTQTTIPKWVFPFTVPWGLTKGKLPQNPRRAYFYKTPKVP